MGFFPGSLKSFSSAKLSRDSKSFPDWDFHDACATHYGANWAHVTRVKFPILVIATVNFNLISVTLICLETHQNAFKLRCSKHISFIVLGLPTVQKLTRNTLDIKRKKILLALLLEPCGRRDVYVHSCLSSTVWTSEGFISMILAYVYRRSLKEDVSFF